MARQLRIEYRGAFYHITTRGNQKQTIFVTDDDRYFFLNLLREAEKKFGAVFHTFCIMGNHYHFLLETPRGNLSQIMHFINASYSGYFNWKHERVGHVFQGRFKAILVEKETYALELSRYIHLNPVRAGIVDMPEAFPWSSYREYLGFRATPSWLNIGLVLSYFGPDLKIARSKYRKFVIEAIGRPAENPIKKTEGSLILGSDEFVARIKEKYLPEKIGSREIPALRILNEKEKPSLAAICLAINEKLGKRSRISRNVAIYLCRERTDFSLSELAQFFRIGNSAICMAHKLIKKKIAENYRLKNEIDEIESHLFGA